KGFSPTETLLLRLSIALSGPDRDFTRDVAASCFGLVYDRFAEIAETSERLARGMKVDDQLFAGALMLPPGGAFPRQAKFGYGAAEGWIVFVDTLRELAGRYPTASRIVAGNLTHEAAEMRRIAETRAIDISDFWTYSPPGTRRKKMLAAGAR